MAPKGPRMLLHVLIEMGSIDEASSTLSTLEGMQQRVVVLGRVLE